MMIATGEYPSFVYRHGGVQQICKRLKLVQAVGFQARDGHFVRSFFELLLDEYLYSRQIDHTPEVKPFKDHNFRCDQKVGGFYIELWGYSDFGNYVKRRKQKEQLYRRQGLTLIPLEVSFFRTTVGKVERQFDNLFSRLGFSVVKKEPFSMRVIAQAVNYPWDEDAIKAHLQKYISRYREFPTQKKLSANGMSGLAARVGQFGGFPYFRSLMGFQPWRRKRKWSEAAITAHLLGFCERLKRFPKDEELSSDLRNAIRRHSVDGPRDLNYYRMKLGYPITKQSVGYWTEDAIQTELKKVINTSGSFPTNSFLKETRRDDLSGAVQQSGGFNKWRQKLGYPIIQHSPNQYTDESLKEWLRIVTFEKGRLPTQKELRQLDSKKQAAAARRGGITHWLTLLAEEDPTMRGYLKSYLQRNGGQAKGKAGRRS